MARSSLAADTQPDTTGQEGYTESSSP